MRIFLTIAFLLPAFSIASAYADSSQKAVVDEENESDRKVNASLAVLLSLQPMPISLGHFYNGNWGAGLLFTIGEALLAATSMGTMMAETVDTMRHDPGSMNPVSNWSAEGQAVFFSSLAAYVAIKVVDAVSAGLTAPNRGKDVVSE